MKKNKVEDVFGMSRNVPLNYVERENVDDVLKNNLERKKHITIFGSSKQGKTCLRKHCLDEKEYILIQCNNKWNIGDLNTNILKRAGYEITQSKKVTETGRAKILASLKAKLGFGEGSVGFEAENSESTESVFKELELDSEDVNDIISALDNIGFKKYIILEDFHYLKTEVQRDFAIELKSFHENSKLSFIVIGVWLDVNRLEIYNGDLAGRIISINADTWEEEQLKEVIEKGENLLNISFNEKFVDDLIKNSFQNVYIVQEACYKICSESGIEETQDIKKEIGENVDAPNLVKEIINQQSGRYNSFILHYAAGFQSTTLEIHKWILYPIIMSDTEELSKGLTYRKIKEMIQSKHPIGTGLNSGNLTQALHFSAALQLTKSIQPIIIDYDETNLKLHVVDKGFLIWIEYQDKNELLERAGIEI